MMRDVSIEELLIWAYRDQMVHAARAEGMPAEITLGYSPALATIDLAQSSVDASVRVDFDCAPDAYAVHRAVMKLRSVERPTSVEEIDCLFARWAVANELRRAQGREVLTDHNKIREKLFGRQPEIVNLPSLVFEWAMKAQRPDWCEFPLYEWRRGPTIYRGKNHAIGRLVDPIGDDPIDVERARAVYSLWAHAVAQVGDSLVGQSILKSHRLTKPAPKAEPWAV